MEVAGIALVAIFVVVGLVMTPMRIGKRQALVASREGDRFSVGMRVITSPESTGDSSEITRADIDEQESRLGRSSTPLLTNSSSHTKTSGVQMANSNTPNRPRVAKRSHVVNLSPQQAKEMTTLKTKRAARLSRESAAGRRRLVTAAIAVGLVGVAVALAAFGLVAWWVCVIPGFFLAGSLVTSRLAAVASERASEEETRRFRLLREDIQAALSTEMPISIPASIPPRKIVERPVVVAEVEQVEESSRASADVRDSEPNAVEEAATVASVAVRIDSDSIDGEWSVSKMPEPVSVRKARAMPRQVHADTDIRGVPRVNKAPGRPVEASTLDSAVDSEVASSFTLNLDEVLESRRAQ